MTQPLWLIMNWMIVINLNKINCNRMYQMVYFFVSYAMSYVFTRFLQKKNNEVEAIQENLYFDSEGIIEKEIDDESLEVGVEYGIYDPITP